MLFATADAQDGFARLFGGPPLDGKGYLKTGALAGALGCILGQLKHHLWMHFFPHPFLYACLKSEDELASRVGL